MTRPRNSRRTANRVRVSLADDIGQDIDGAWWPYTAAMGRDLADLVEALRPAIGEVVDLQINWLAQSPTPVLSTMSAAANRVGWNSARQRVMCLTGSTGAARILVVPSMTPVPLALMLLRVSARRPVPVPERASSVFEVSEQIVRAAQLAVAAWPSAETPPKAR